MLAGFFTSANRALDERSLEQQKRVAVHVMDEEEFDLCFTHMLIKGVHLFVIATPVAKKHFLVSSLKALTLSYYTLKCLNSSVSVPYFTNSPLLCTLLIWLPLRVWSPFESLLGVIGYQLRTTHQFF